MLTSEDIKILIEAERSVFATKDDIQDLKGSFSNLQSSVDGFMKVSTSQTQENVMVKNRLDRHESWIEKLAAKIGIILS